MKYKYVYRKHIGYIRKSIPYILGFLYSITALVFILNIFSEHSIFMFMTIFSFAISIGLTIALIPNWFFLRRFQKVHVTLSSDSIVYENIKEKTIIPINEITAIKFPSIKYTGGWIKIISPNKTIRLTVVLENLGDFMVKLKESLELLDNAAVYDEKKFFNFYKTAVFSDQSWDRLYEYFKRFFVLGLIILIGCTIVLFKTDYIFLKPFTSMIPLYLYGLFFSIAEYVIASKVGKTADPSTYYIAPRDSKFEKKIYGIFLGFYILLVILWGVLIF